MYYCYFLRIDNHELTSILRSSIGLSVKRKDPVILEKNICWQKSSLGSFVIKRQTHFVRDALNRYSIFIFLKDSCISVSLERSFVTLSAFVDPSLYHLSCDNFSDFDKHRFHTFRINFSGKLGRPKHFLSLCSLYVNGIEIFV